jgi:hypothetical protein
MNLPYVRAAPLYSSPCKQAMAILQPMLLWMTQAFPTHTCRWLTLLTNGMTLCYKGHRFWTCTYKASHWTWLYTRSIHLPPILCGVTAIKRKSQSCSSLRTTLWKRIVERRYRSAVLNLGTRWRWVDTFTPRPLFPGERIHSTHRIVLDAMKKRKICCLCWELNAQPAACLDAVLTELPWCSIMYIRAEGKVSKTWSCDQYIPPKH